MSERDLEIKLDIVETTQRRLCSVHGMQDFVILRVGDAAFYVCPFPPESHVGSGQPTIDRLPGSFSGREGH